MSRYAPLHLPPSRLDKLLARGIADHTASSIEKSLKVTTWLADEKILLSAAALFWLSSRRRTGRSTKRCADQILMNAVISSALPHVIKLLVARERPDRTVVHGIRHGVPRSGNAWVLSLGPRLAFGRARGGGLSYGEPVEPEWHLALGRCAGDNAGVSSGALSHRRAWRPRDWRFRRPYRAASTALHAS